MKTTETLLNTPTDRDDNVVRGAFEAPCSIKDLATELGVSVQTLYDLLPRGAVRSGSGWGATCGSVVPRSRPG